VRASWLISLVVKLRNIWMAKSFVSSDALIRVELKAFLDQVEGVRTEVVLNSFKRIPAIHQIHDEAPHGHPLL
jgi:hypothetical protein